MLIGDQAPRCERCGEDCAIGARYCFSCGAALSTQTEDTEAERKRFALYRCEEVRRFVGWLLRGNGDLRPQRNGETGEYVYTGSGENSLRIISELESSRVLEKYLIDTVPACPSCEHSNFYVDYLCPLDQHRSLRRGIMIEHYACAHTDFESNFKTGDDMVCPKCKRTLKLIGTDYRKIDKIYSCPACGKFFSTPLIEFTCRMCGKVSRPDEIMMQAIFAYRINPELRGELMAHCSLEKPILDILKRQGFTVAAPKTLRGLSGIKHTFDMYGWKEGAEIALDVTSGATDIGPEGIVGFFAKIYDTKPHRAVLVTMPNITKDAQRLCSMYGIQVVAGRTIDEVVERLTLLLSQPQTGISTARMMAINALESVILRPKTQPSDA